MGVLALSRHSEVFVMAITGLSELTESATTDEPQSLNDEITLIWDSSS